MVRLKIKISIIKLKKLWHKLNIKLATSLYSVIQQCQVHQIFVFCVFSCDLKDKYIRKKRKACMWNHYYFDLAKINVGLAYTKKIKLPLPKRQGCLLDKIGYELCHRCFSWNFLKMFTAAMSNSNSIFMQWVLLKKRMGYSRT